MKGKFFKIIFIFLALFLVFYFLNSFKYTQAQTTAIQAIVKITVCGNNIKEPGEQCDGTDLSGQTCVGLGYIGGTLTCRPDCTFNIAGCTTAPPPAPGPAPAPAPPPETGASFSGRAYPNQSVTLLQDGRVVATTIAGSDAFFSIRVTGLATGIYLFSLYSEDHRGIRSSLLTFPLSITSGTITNVTGIFIAPSIDVDKSEVRRGDDIAIFGQTVPESNITIEISGSPSFFAQTVADKAGIYLYYHNTAPMDYGTYYAKSKAVIGTEALSSFSRAVSFSVGTRTVLKGRPGILRGDLNKDGKVNLVDFSIAAYWYRRSLSSAMKEIECERLNCDGAINLIDFSIMAYYWTG